MKIASINQKNINFHDGLNDIYLPRLGRIVILAGPNGSGKTRLLTRITRMSTDSINNANLTNKVLRRFPSIEKDSDGAIRHKEGRPIDIKEIVNIHPSPWSINVKFEGASADHSSIASLVAVNLGLQDCEDLSPRMLIEHAEKAKKPGFENLPGSCLPYIRQLQQRYWDATHQNSGIDAERRTFHKDTYLHLCDLIEIVLGAYPKTPAAR